MSTTGCPSPQLQPTESSPSGCSGLGSACSWGLSHAGIVSPASSQGFLLPVVAELVSWAHSLLFPKPLAKTWGNVVLSIHLLFDLLWV